MVASIMTCQAITIGKNNKQQLLQGNNHVISDNWVIHIFLCGNINNNQTIRLSMIAKKIYVTTMATSWWHWSWYVKQSWLTKTKNSTFHKQTTMSFLTTEPQISCSTHEWPWSPIFMQTMWVTMPDGWLVLFYAATWKFGDFWHVTHRCDTLVKMAMHMWIALYLGPEKLTKMQMSAKLLCWDLYTEILMMQDTQ